MRGAIVFLPMVAAGVASAGLLNLVQCPDCGAMASTRAFMCPKCGCNAEAVKHQADAGEKAARLSKRETAAVLAVKWVKKEAGK